MLLFKTCTNIYKYQQKIWMDGQSYPGGHPGGPKLSPNDGTCRPYTYYKDQ